MTSPPGNGTPIVPGKGYTAQTIYQLQNVDPDALGAASNLDLWEMLENFRNKLLTDLLGGFLNVPAAVGAAVGEIVGAITGLLDGGLDDLFNWSHGVDTRLADLQDKTQALEGVVGYGCSYMDTSHSGSLGTNFQLMQFDRQVGPMVGCSLDGYGYVLQSKGLWRIDAQMFYDVYLVGAQNTEFEIRVFTPTESVFAVMTGFDDTSRARSLNTQLPVVVPAAGYKVRVYARAGVGRGFLGGPDRTYLNVFKLSSETS